MEKKLKNALHSVSLKRGAGGGRKNCVRGTANQNYTRRGCQRNTKVGGGKNRINKKEKIFFLRGRKGQGPGGSGKGGTTKVGQ